ncbi:hypothetical protein NA57DRAFT_30202 [Rhizodiscina lignyota]|uniref:glucan 1,4-alpha-glucosidase n=1 Tax=Rhizodiscina lignyota TaxID=1504668 RepID=A0A9P4IMC3_9PEZI|nr:hypothetical protein NA57DRAFT_30202 [Rhizodiscina lignyota]
MAWRRQFQQFLLSLNVVLHVSYAQAPTPYATPTGLASDITSYLEASSSSEAGLAKTLMFANIDVDNSANGTVIAAQSYSNPNYAYNWVRDASLTMDVVQSLYAAATSDAARDNYANILFAYAGARTAEQNDPDLQTGLGEPKFNLNNTVFTGPWGRPQNDGPATSATTLMQFATAYMNNGGSQDTVNDQIYQAPVKADLLFVASNWSSPSFDIWEEESSNHFYNRLVSHRALVLGAAFATKMGDDSTSSTLSSAASDVANSLSVFWDADLGIIKYEDGPVLNNKNSYQDIAVILGVIHGYNDDGVFSYSNDQVLSTAYHLAISFLDAYPIAANQHTDSSGASLGIPIGRYPEDIYTGTGTAENGGNPWFLCTAAMAELFYRAASDLQSAGQLTVSNTSLLFWTYFSPGANLSEDTYSSDSDGFKGAIAALQGWGDAFIRLIQYHGGDGGHLSEEYDRNSGVMVGAADLTWSYASVITAAFARAEQSGDDSYVQDLANLGF